VLYVPAEEKEVAIWLAQARTAISIFHALPTCGKMGHKVSASAPSGLWASHTSWRWTKVAALSVEVLQLRTRHTSLFASR
jgi:hypothetical protein